MVRRNEGETPSSYDVNGNHRRSARSTVSGRQQLQMQFDAWMNSLNIAKIPETVFKGRHEKGKRKAAADTSGSSIPVTNSFPMQHKLGNSAPENQPSNNTPSKHNQEVIVIDENHTYSTPMASAYPKNQPEAAIAPKVFNGQTYNPSQDGELWQQVETNASFGNLMNESSNFAQNYQYDIPQRSKDVTNNFAEANKAIPLMQFETSEETLSNRKKLKVSSSPPNMLPNNKGKSKKKGNHEGGNGNNDGNTEKNETNGDDDEIMIISPPPSVRVPPSSSVVPSDLNDIFPSLDSLDDNTPWVQKMQDTPIWEWDDLYFP